MDGILDEQQLGEKHDPSGTAVGPYGHGPGGIFNIPGTQDRVVSAIMNPLSGVAAELPVYNGGIGVEQNQFGGEMQELQTVLTGVTTGNLDDFSNQPTTDCADGPEGGLMKVCTFVNTYGRYRASTKEVSMFRAGMLASAIEPLTLQLMNAPALREGAIGNPSAGISVRNTLLNELARRVYESVVSFQRMFSKRFWIGSPSNNSGERRDIMGMDLHINEGTHVDYLSSAVCTAADSDIKNFGYDNVNGTGRNIVEYIEMVDAYVMWNAEQQGLTPYEYRLAMRPEAFRQISAQWPVRAHIDALLGVAQYTNISLNLGGNETLQERNRLRRERVLPVNGRDVRVILDDSIPESNITNNGNLTAGQYASDVYFVPWTVMGGVPATFWRYYNYANGQAEAIANFRGIQNPTFTTDNGLFRWYVNFKNGCLKLNYEMAPKLVMLTPQLGARIKNVKYVPLQHFRSAYPDQGYFFNGGVTSQPTQKYYAPWSTTVPVNIPS